eukprot:3867420-Pyramimonas_sp.AAC.1
MSHPLCNPSRALSLSTLSRQQEPFIAYFARRSACTLYLRRQNSTTPDRGVPGRYSRLRTPANAWARRGKTN